MKRTVSAAGSLGIVILLVLGGILFAAGNGATLIPSPRSVSATGTPGPAVRLSPPEELAIHGNLAPEQLYDFALDGTALVSAADVPGGTDIALIDLSSGNAETLIHIAHPDGRGIEDLRTAGHYAVWTEIGGQLHVFDLASRHEVPVFQQDAIRDPDIKQDLAVWEEWRGQTPGIYGFDLAANRTVTVTTRMASEPHVCSRQWVIYLRNIVAGRSGAADLYAQDLNTGESFRIGQVPYLADLSAGKQHACDGQRIAWYEARWTQSGLIERQHLYDLTQRQDRILNMPLPVGHPPDLRLYGDVLLGTAGYDLQLGVAFATLEQLAPEQTYGGPLAFAGDTFVWRSTYPGAAVRLYTARIIRTP